jgi:hypothetical protein
MKNRYGMKLQEACKQHGVDVALAACRQAIKDKRVQREEISLQEMAVSMMGEDFADRLERYWNMARSGLTEMQLKENADAVDASNFSIIGGQLMMDIIKDNYQYAAQKSDEWFSKRNVGKNLGTAVIPWLSDVLDEPAVVNQLQEYPRTQFSLNYITRPAPVKFGRICAVAMEELISDKTQQAYDRARSVGRRAGLFKHKQRLRVMYGIVNNHSFNGTSYNTYLTAGAWINKLTSFSLLNWTSFNTLEQLQNQMTDPTTGEVIDIEVNQVLVLPALKYTTRRILNATAVLSGNITSGTGDQVVSENPLDRDYTMYSDKHARKILVNEGGLTATQADTVVLAGDFKKAFVEWEVYPTRYTTAAPNNIWEFTRDIALAAKVSDFYIDSVWDPRYVYYAYNSAA